MDSDSSSLAGRPRLRGEGDSSLLSFFLGPVQPFIASARSVRDLWSGSFLLSWLTRSAMSPVLENPGLGDDAFLMPFQPSLVWDRCLKAGGELPAAGLPNRFLATIPADPEGTMWLAGSPRAVGLRRTGPGFPQGSLGQAARRRSDAGRCIGQ